MSALDLFASAMGIFVLLSVMLLPYFFKGKEYEEEIGRLELAAAESAAEARAAAAETAEAEQRVSAIEELPGVELDAERRALAEEEQRKKALAAKIQELKKKTEDQRRALASKPVTKKKKVNKVTFRFLGLKTDADSYLILVDGAKRIKERAENLPDILKEIVSVFGPGKEYAIGFYNFAGGAFNYARWPRSGFVEGGPESYNDAIDFMRQQHRKMRGGSATADALLTAVKDSAESIILVSDGVIFPKHNNGMKWRAIVDGVTRANVGKVEINSVAIGIFYRNPDFWTFLNELRRRNGGDLKAIPPRN